jgi:uncharacterized LabA/DUF88 family protein
MKRVLVIIDGSNFYHGCKNLAPKVHLTNFNYRKLIEKVAGKNSKIFYCVGEIRKEKNNKKSEQLYALQQSLFYTLEKQGIAIYKGFMLKSDGKYHEKGVDVRMAVEIIKGSFRDEYDKCYLFSSDTDIIPAILEAKKQHKKIIYVGFDKKLSRAMDNNCSETRVISAKEIIDCSH